MTTAPLGEPATSLRDPQAIAEGQLDHQRDALLRKLASLSDAERSRSRLPSGWTPLGLLKHLRHVERRWLQWGFLGEQVADPWGDERPGSDAWFVADDETYEVLRAHFEEQVERSRAITGAASLNDLAVMGGRFEADPPNLAWILLHLVQEYARHVGHLDIVVELAGGGLGE